MNTADQINQRGTKGILSASGTTLALRVLAFLLALLTVAATIVPMVAAASLIGAYLLDLAYAWIGPGDSHRAGAVWAVLEGWHLLCIPVAILSGLGARALARRTPQAP